ncbi:MAG: hypothetical protein AB7I27_06010 [Bacteriovoracaceae bacterium]
MKIIINFIKSARIVFILSACLLTHYSYALNSEFFSQTVYLQKFKDTITQNKLILFQDREQIEIFGGVYYDDDTKTNAKRAFTDAQVSPLSGLRSKAFGPNWLMSRLSFEGRLVHRTKSFPDDRARTTYELRPGVMGYGLKEFGSGIFLENYYAVFYSQLYGEKIITQGWGRQGFRLMGSFDLFHEVFFDTFDQTRKRQGTLDLRPGVRLFKNFAGGSIQLLHQRLHHMTNLEFAGRNESRTTLVIGYYF